MTVVFAAGLIVLSESPQKRSAQPPRAHSTNPPVHSATNVQIKHSVTSFQNLYTLRGKQATK